MAKAVLQKPLMLTTNELVVKRNDKVLAKRYKVLQLHMPYMRSSDKFKWLKRNDLINAAATSDVSIISCVYDFATSAIYLMAPIDCDSSKLVVTWEQKEENTYLYPEPYSWENVSDYLLVRLLINTCNITLDDECTFSNVTGSLYQTIKQTKTLCKTLELTADTLEDNTIILNANVRTLTRKSSLIKAAGNNAEELGKIYSLPCYTVGSNGYLTYAPYNSAPKDVFCFRRCKGDNKKSRVDFLVLHDNKHPIKKKLAKTYALNMVISTINKRFLQAAALEFRTYGDITRGLNNYSGLKSKIFELLRGQVLTVSYYDESLRAAANTYTNFLSGLSAVIAPELSIVGPKNEPDPATLNIQVVPDLDEDDSPVINHDVPYPIQHVTRSSLAEMIEKQTIASVLSNLLKELVVKQDIQDGYFGCAELLDGKKASISSVINLGKSEKPQERVLRFCHLYVDEQGRMAFNSHGEDEGARNNTELQREGLLCKTNWNGEIQPIYDNYVVAIGEGEALIHELNAITLPNEMAEMFKRLLKGVNVRKKTNGSLFRFLTPVYGISLFERDKKKCYAVGVGEPVGMTIGNAARIREIKPLSGPDISRLIIKQLETERVRNGQASVVPVMAKYLNEFARMKDSPVELQRRQGEALDRIAARSKCGDTHKKDAGTKAQDCEVLAEALGTRYV